MNALSAASLLYWIVSFYGAIPFLILDESLTPNEFSKLIGANDDEVFADEDVVRPADAHDVDVILTIVYLRNTVDNAPRIGDQRSFRRIIRLCSANDRPRSLAPVLRDLTDLFVVSFYLSRRGPPLRKSPICQ
jgi:hypothetical protein